MAGLLGDAEQERRIIVSGGVIEVDYDQFGRVAGVYFLLDNGDEVVCWVYTEWEEDPTSAAGATIAAMAIAYDEGMPALRDRLYTPEAWAERVLDLRGR